MGLVSTRALAGPSEPASGDGSPAGQFPGFKLRVNVSLNESPYGPSPRVTQLLRNNLDRLERYTGEDANALCRQLAELERVSEQQILLGEVLEPLGLFLGAQGGAGGEFLYSDPGYTALVDAAKPVGGIGIPLALNGELENDLPAFRARVSARTRAAFLVNPHNPSGTLSDASAFRAFVGELSQHTLVVVDEAYLDYCDDFHKRTCVERVRAGDNVIVFRTFSKLHGLAALPLGYAVAPKKLAETLRKQGLGSPRALNRLAVLAASASLSDPDHLGRVRAKVATERTRWREVLRSLGLRHTDARASFVFFEGKQPQAQIAAALAEQGIEIGRAFPPLHDWTRISIGLPAENQLVQSALRSLLT
jgi:histidinol-phosphate aminotransferase